MVYWYDIPSDQNYLNPFQEMTVKSDIEKFLLFEQDGAGFNNRRMSIETILTMGISMGRTIVPPPRATNIHVRRPRKAKASLQF
jgi:hypothetical protein